MGKQEITINTYTSPKELESETIEGLIEVARRAFSADSFPSRKDALEHIGSATSLTVAFKDGDPIGFCSVKRLNPDLILHHAIAVDPEHQGKGIGTRLLDLAILEEDPNNNFLLGGRTQSPFYINYIKKRGGYPRKNQTAPQEIQRGVEKIAEFYSGDLNRKEHLLEKSYIKSPYDEPDAVKAQENLGKLFKSQVNFLKGDAVLPVTKTSKSIINEKLNDS